MSDTQEKKDVVFVKLSKVQQKKNYLLKNE